MLKQFLRRNPHVSKGEIHDLFEKQLGRCLDDEFEEYCSEDDYYQPVVEDFKPEYG